MATSIRLSRGGSKKRPYYKIVVADSRSPRDGRFIERLGSYNPLLAKDNPERIKLDAERAAHWLSVGAQPTDRVARFLDAAGIKATFFEIGENVGQFPDVVRRQVRGGMVIGACAPSMRTEERGKRSSPIASSFSDTKKSVACRCAS